MSDDPKFDLALAFVLRHEGSGFTEDPADPGGATKYGVSLRFLRQLGNLDGLYAGLDLNADDAPDADTILALTEVQAAQIYRQTFWDRYGYGAIEHWGVAAKVFDVAVNAGPHEAALILQRALRACWEPPLAPIEDGILGPKTLDRANLTDPRILGAALKSEAAGYYRVLAEHPDRARFLEGWLNRAYDFVRAAS